MCFKNEEQKTVMFNLEWFSVKTTKLLEGRCNYCSFFRDFHFSNTPYVFSDSLFYSWGLIINNQAATGSAAFFSVFS